VAVPVSVSVTGQIVVESAMVEVTTTVESAGQLVIDAAQLVTVISRVVKTVDVVHFCEVVAAGVLFGVGTDKEIGEVTGELSGELPLGLDPIGVDFTAGVVSA
jgi:hypothetical protein